MERRQRKSSEEYSRTTRKVRSLGKANYHEKRIVTVGPGSYQIDPLPQEEIIPAVQRLINGEAIDFRSESASKGAWREINRKNGPIQQTLFAMLDENEAEAGKGYGMLADDFGRFVPDKSLLRDKKLLSEWVFKLTIGLCAHLSINGSIYDNKDLLNSESARYSNTVEEQISVFKQTLASLDIDDLPNFIYLDDMLRFYGVSGLLNTSMQDELKETVDPDFLISVAAKDDELRTGLLREDRDTWNRLRVNWGSKQVGDVVSLLPGIRSPVVMDHVVCALEDNLFDFTNKTEVDGSDRLGIDPSGIVALLKWKGESAYGKETFRDLYPRVVQRVDENVEFTNFSVPRRHLPHTAISLLIEAAKRSDRAEVGNLIKDIDQSTVGENVSVPWLVTLLALKAHDPELSELIEQTVSGLDDFPVNAKEIFLNSRPGKLWLTKDGKLRSTDNKTMLLSAFPIYTSSKEVDEIVIVEPQKPKVQEPKKPEAKSLSVDSIDNVSFFGEIGRVKNSDAKALIDSTIKDRIDLDDDELLNRFEQLTIAWKRRDPSLRNRNLLYIAQLNLRDDFLAKAQRSGIEGVHINGEETTLILDKDLAFANTSDKTMALGLHGKVDGFGNLIVDGMDESFVGEKEHLFLNNLVLHLALQPLLYTSGIPEDSDRDIIRRINDVISSWNRSSSRGSLPRIDRKAKDLNLAVRIAGYSEPVLVGEKS